MARQPNPIPAAFVDNTRADVLAADGKALAVLSEHSMKIADEFDDGRPYERARLMSESRVLKSTAGEAMIELGKRLIVIKENEPYGEFTEIVENQLGIPARTARRFMSAAAKFVRNPRTANLAVLGKTKLLELMDESDEDLEQLAEGGTLAGATLDEIQTMTARELRALVLKERQEKTAKDKVIAKKDQKLNALAEKEEIRRSGTRNERETLQVSDLRDAGLAAEQSLMALLATVDEVLGSPATDSAELQARQTLDYVVQRLADMCGERGIGVDVLGERVEPGWVREITGLVEEAGAKKRRS